MDVHLLPSEPGHPPRNSVDEGLGWLAVPVCETVMRSLVAVLGELLETDPTTPKEAAVEKVLEEAETMIVVSLFILVFIFRDPTTPPTEPPMAAANKTNTSNSKSQNVVRLSPHILLINFGSSYTS